MLRELERHSALPGRVDGLGREEDKSAVVVLGQIRVVHGHVAQRLGGRRAEHRTVEPELFKGVRQTARVLEVAVRQQHRVHVARHA
jgi:hypothetical protein